MSVRETIAATFEIVAREQNRKLEKLTDQFAALGFGTRFNQFCFNRDEARRLARLRPIRQRWRGQISGHLR